jgi:peptidoglycan hydrolase-like protein with peptidoglycan-binding domain
MTAAALTHLPVAAGGALMAATGNALHWGFARYMRAPLANTGILAMLTLSAMASSNALYWQSHDHPAPLFAQPTSRQAAIAPAAVEPVVPATRPTKALPAVVPPPSAETTGSVEPESRVVHTIGNTEVTEIQRKLTALKLYDGAIDGLYGPRTARAIKAFEQQAGMRPKGELTVELLEAVRAAPAGLSATAADALPKPDPLPVAGTSQMPSDPVPTATRQVVTQPLSAPEPLSTEIEPSPAAAEQPATTTPVLHRELPETPQEAFELAVATAGDAIDTIIQGVQTVTMTTPGRKPAAETQQFAAAPAAAKPEPKIELASIAEPKVGVTLALPEMQATVEPEIAILEGDAKPEDLMPPFSVTDPVIVAKVQRGLASLGFLYGPADGVAGEATAKAIRNFEVYYNYRVTGRISPELLDLLVQNGAAI